MVIRLFVALFFLSSVTYSQNLSLDQIVSGFEGYQTKLSREKLYLHSDKATYTSGDTVWFKAYLLDAAFMTASMQSGVVHIELVNDTGKVVLQRILEVKQGLGSGNITLTPSGIPEGSYILKAYTTLMRNFGQDAAYSKALYVSGRSGSDLIVNTRTRYEPAGFNDSLRVGLQFKRPDQSVVRERNMQIRITDGKKVYFRESIITNRDGVIDMNFKLPEGSDVSQLVVLASEETAGGKLPEIRIPLVLNRIDQVDLQFTPEGGHLVAGLPVRIGFKALSESGSGIDVSGAVYNRKDEKVADFKSSHRGIGSFELQTQPGEKYLARINGSNKIWPLPEVKGEGTSLRVINRQETDSLEVFVTFSAGLRAAEDHYLVGQYNGVICYTGAVKGNSRLRIAKELFSTGIARFTLLGPDRKPLNERIVFINRQDELKIKVKSNQQVYSTRDSVGLEVEVTNQAGLPVQGSFSLAITDNTQVKSDVKFNIRANMLLSADLRGTIEDPGYYLLNGTENRDNLDNLLLTQGWVGYDWTDVFNLRAPEYQPEPEFTVEGKVVNAGGKTINGTEVRLLSTRPFFVADQVTNDKGDFKFSEFPPLDSAVVFRLQAKNLRGKNFNVGIELNEHNKPAYAVGKYPTMPWYVNTDTLLLKQIQSKLEEEGGIMNLPAGARVLEEVTVRASKVIPRSKNLNGQGVSDFSMSENEIIGSGKINLMQLIQQKVPKFFIKYFPPPIKEYFYTINGARVFIVIDGIPLDYFYTPQYCGSSTELCPRDYMDFQTRFLEYFTTEDVTGIEVMNWGKNSYRYTAEFPRDNSLTRSLNGLNGQVVIRTTAQPAYSWIEITTRSGRGPQFRSEPGSYVYRPPAFVSKKEFYTPKYPGGHVISLPDVRSTIHWEPWITTDEKGRARVSFYTSDRKGSYTVDIQGADLNGSLGNADDKIRVD